MSIEGRASPLQLFRFHVTFAEHTLQENQSEKQQDICSGAFSDVSGLEATMEPRVIKEGGRNWGAVQRSGPVTFSTVILKRGVTRSRDLWRWFSGHRTGVYSLRMTVVITMYDPAGGPVLAWKLDNALPIKFKFADVNAKGSEVSVEELHLTHEGMSLVNPIALPRGTDAE